ncbi:uncharacterized protein LACBIDRAFT_320856 [Laccaria bicolor S238N-H82]|uniref:Predicted protein n=1 Tax=Laccaria bicolor (strain S238N-H82 / ATCC MYA-4686) TaxID=486041 RepID=B0CRH8_LACBS|nr:uncharacterized protein LACBIDRAFT_320856 [Laccaria bicolor S238N-H82]EDR15203.1 predicted protein [Laccaria bicolor S238N-H82]|eukprot:XP_001873411.1 predicted protein [Laccaria bicolor S238N-H82]
MSPQKRARSDENSSPTPVATPRRSQRRDTPTPTPRNSHGFQIIDGLTPVPNLKRRRVFTAEELVNREKITAKLHKSVSVHFFWFVFSNFRNGGHVIEMYLSSLLRYDPLIGQGVRSMSETDPNNEKIISGMSDFIIPPGAVNVSSPTSLKGLRETLASPPVPA